MLIANVAKVNDISARELAQYFIYREQTITALKILHDENNTCEKDLHNLFMEMGKTSIEEQGDFSIYNSNLWLLDDKFMSFAAAFSDVKIQEIKKKILESYEPDEDDLKKPDLALFYSKVNDDQVDLIVVEFKAIGSKALAKSVAIPEVERNIGAIAASFDNIRNIYGYVITGLDDEFCRILKRSGLSKLYSAGQYPIFYKYNNGIEDANGQNIDTHIYILSAETVCFDAASRNKPFMDILKNN